MKILILDTYKEATHRISKDTSGVMGLEITLVIVFLLTS